jgi:high affinity Mn2+ porin
MNLCTIFTGVYDDKRSMNFVRVARWTLLCVLSVVCADPRARAQTSPDAQTAPSADSPDAPTIFPHSDRSRYLLAGQANIIFQADPPFHSPYAGTNSFISRGEYKTSMVGTIYMGYQLFRAPSHSTEFFLDTEEAGGRGLGEALGIAGFTNLDVVRNPNLGRTPYLARYFVRQTIGLGSRTVEAERGVFSLSTLVPERRIEFRFGKMGLPDFFDINSVGTDSHLQFVNWAIDNDGAYDYAADTRGYTYAAMAEYDDKAWSARYALALMPNVANGTNLEWDLHRASSQNWEFELRKSPLGPLVKADRHGVVRVLSYVNHAHMGLYRDAIDVYLEGKTAKPEITSVEKFGAVKYGFGFNAEQELTSALRVFTRVGWNEGQHESYAYTEIDQTVQVGGDYSGTAWRRPFDKAGVAFATNGIKHDHQEYLKLGGLGFILGDGNLSYGRENILEGYYNAHTWRGLYTAFDTQWIEHPGYNTVRGPVVVFSVRTHVDF